MTWKRSGHVFRGHSDTEVVPHLYEEDGLDCLSQVARHVCARNL